MTSDESTEQAIQAAGVADALCAGSRGKLKIAGRRNGLVLHYIWFDLDAKLDVFVCDTLIGERERVYASEIRLFNKKHEYVMTREQAAREMAERIIEWREQFSQ